MKEVMGTKASDRSMPIIKNFSSTGGLKLDDKKSAAFPGDIDFKNCSNISKIPRPQIKVCSSLNDNLHANLGKGKAKKAPAASSKSKSIRQNENEQSSALNAKEFSGETKVSDGKTKKRGAEPPLISRHNETCEKNENQQERHDANRTKTLKFSTDLIDVKNEESMTSYKDAEDQASYTPQTSRSTSKKGLEKNKSTKAVVCVEEREKEKQEKMIGYLYETLKCTAGSLFESFARMSPRKEPEINADATRSGAVSPDGKTHCEPVPDFSSIQEHYEFTLREISNIWRNAMSLIVCVKEHTVKFVEENSRVVDKEQLTLEAEMLQLAIDFAISYSKLKTDFLIKSVKKCLNVKDSGKTELETFMDSKIFAAVYSNDDLTEMARTVQELKRSVVKDENAELS